MNTKNDGGPFFPKHLRERKIDPYTPEELAAAAGISLRDWFAGMALQATINTGVEGTVESAAKELGINPSDYKPSVHWPILVARDAYAFADAMIAERNKP